MEPSFSQSLHPSHFSYSDLPNLSLPLIADPATQTHDVTAAAIFPLIYDALNHTHPMITSRPAISSSALDRAELIWGAYVSPIVCLFGIACNALNLIILTRRNMTGSPYTYLLGLAVTDISVLTLSLVESALSKTVGRGVYFWQFYEAFVFYPFGNVFSNSSVWITVLLTVERYISVRYPLKAKKLCTRRLARRSIIVTVLLLFLLNIPRFLVYTVEPTPCSRAGSPLHCPTAARIHAGDLTSCRGFLIPDDSSSHLASSVCYERKSSAFESSDFYVTWNWVYISLIHFIPCVLLMYLNVGLITIVYRANRRRMSLRGSPCWMGYSYEAGCYSKEQIRLTVTCISIICLFLVCIVPSAFSNRPVAKVLFGQGKPMDEFTKGSFYRLLRVTTNLLVFCNLSMNFVLYCVFNHKFLYTLRRLGNTYVLGALIHEAPPLGGAGGGASSGGGGGGGHFRRLSSATSMGGVACAQSVVGGHHCVSVLSLKMTSHQELMMLHQGSMTLQQGSRPRGVPDYKESAEARLLCRGDSVDSEISGAAVGRQKALKTAAEALKTANAEASSIGEVDRNAETSCIRVNPRAGRWNFAARRLFRLGPLRAMRHRNLSQIEDKGELAV